MVHHEILAFLDREAFTVPEFHVMKFVHYAAASPDDTIRLASAESKWWNGRLPPASRVECEMALHSLIARGILQIVDEASLGRIREILAADPAWGPFIDLPEIGHVDFTEGGGSFWQQVDRDVFHRTETWTGFDADGTATYVASSEEGCRRAMSREVDSKEVISIGEPEPIGPWRDRWWDRKWATGFRIVVRYHPRDEDFDDPPPA